MSKRFSAGSITLVASIALAACGGAEAPAASPAAPPPPAETAAPSAMAAPPASAAPTASAAPAASAAPSASAAPAAAAVPAMWKDGMTKDEQLAFMKANVAPRMGKVFQAQDAKRYGEFGCKTCHGPNYKAPKDFLPKLTMKAGKLTAFADKPAVAKFMAEKVVPEMAAAMGQKPYDPATKEGFGCAGCHTIEMK